MNSSITRGDFKVAYKTLREARWRSLFTTFGVIIGVASVVTVVSIGEGIKHQVSGQINRLGQDLIMVRPNASSGGLLSNLSQNNASILTPDDEKTVETSSKVKTAVPLSVVTGGVQFGGHNHNEVVVIGTGSNLPKILKQGLAYGEFFTDDNQDQNVAVVGQNVANKLFDGDVPLGETIEIHGQPFIVRGELNKFDAPPLSVDANFNDAIFIPYSTAQQIGNGNAPIYEILAKPTRVNDTNAAVKAIQRNLLNSHGGEQNFSVIKQDQSLSVSNNVVGLLSTLIGGIAGISLLVGGVGIMNIMLVSVTERTREIGIRKALGATNQQISSQFLTEAMLLSSFGGAVGVVISLIVNALLRIFTNLEPVIDWPVVVVAVVTSLAVGMIFGLVPAVKAARREPIDALRYQ